MPTNYMDRIQISYTDVLCLLKIYVQIEPSFGRAAMVVFCPEERHRIALPVSWSCFEHGDQLGGLIAIGYSNLNDTQAEEATTIAMQYSVEIGLKTSKKAKPKKPKAQR